MRSVRFNSWRFDNPIRFGAVGNYLTFAPQGFVREDSPNHTWNDGFSATLQMAMGPVIEPVQMRIDADPFLVPGRLLFQDLIIYLNGLWVGFTRADEAILLTIPIPAAYVSEHENLLAFVMPNAMRPKAIGVGPDARRLGFAFREIALQRQI